MKNKRAITNKLLRVAFGQAINGTSVNNIVTLLTTPVWRKKLSKEHVAKLRVKVAVRDALGTPHDSVTGMLAMLARDAADADHLYRVSVTPTAVFVMCLGIDSIDSTLEGTYPSVSALPQWVQERIALLNMMSVEAPTTEVPGVGRRISEYVYWVYAPNR